MTRHEQQINAILPNWVKVESGGNPRALSKAGAMGLLQLMPGTARDLGVANPYDPQQNLSGGKRYLSSLLDKYGDMRTALMAYHAGSGNMDKYLAGEPSQVGPLTKAYPGKVLGNKSMPVQIAQSEYTMADAPSPPMEQTQGETMPKYDMQGLLNSIQFDKPERKAITSENGSFSPEQQGLLAMGLSMMANSRGTSLPEALGRGGFAAMNTMAGAQDYNRERELEDAKLQDAQYQRDLQDAREKALSGIDWTNVPKEAMPNILMKLGMTDEALKAFQAGGKRPEGVPTGFNVNDDGSLSPMPIAGGKDYMQYQLEMANAKAQNNANIISPVQRHQMDNQDAQLELQRQKYRDDRAEKDNPKPKEIPPAHKMAYVQNNDALRKIDAAIQAINDYPDALGFNNYLGDTIRQRSDPKGVGIRAAIADIGGVKLHDLSGAAISPSESKRLMPFIPQTTDSPETAKAKLLNLRKEYESINGQIDEMYQGYAPLPKRPGGASGSWDAPGRAKQPSVDDLVNHYLGK